MYVVNDSNFTLSTNTFESIGNLMTFTQDITPNSKHRSCVQYGTFYATIFCQVRQNTIFAKIKIEVRG